MRTMPNAGYVGGLGVGGRGRVEGTQLLANRKSLWFLWDKTLCLYLWSQIK